MFKYRVFSRPYFSVFRPNTGKYRIEKTPYLDTFHAVTEAQERSYTYTLLVFLCCTLLAQSGYSM